MVIITNMNLSRELSDLTYIYNQYGRTDLELLLEDFSGGETNWSVPKDTVPGDTVVFMCAKTAKNRLGMATSHIPDSYGDGFRAFADQQKKLYKQYSGHLLGCGVVASLPVYDSGSNRWYADVAQLRGFANPIYMDEFKSFITISMTNSITYLKDVQWDRLKWTVNQKNPGFFKDAVAPSATVLKEEFDRAEKKEAAKPMNQLKKAAQKNASKPTPTTVTTTVYHRNPTIAAYVKKRANGKCQLCGEDAPFLDQNGEPYLECHHIEWLANGGMDAVDNCVALCPNCHRRMHIVNDPKDIIVLKKSVLSKGDPALGI